jgi:type I restriction enzyme, S subunit
MEMRLRLYFDQLGQIPVVFPPEEEQEAIVRFLDAHARLTTRYIRNRRRLIKVLNEQKQAIINRAVTCGLEPSVPLKPSGIDWVGDIPEHWRIDKLKYLAGLKNGIAFKPGDWKHSGVPIIRIKNLNGDCYFNYTDRTDLPQDLLIQPGELLFSWSGNRGTSFGSFLWESDISGYLNQHIFKVTGYSLDKTFFFYVLRAVTAHVEEQTHGIIGLVHITKPELGSIQIPVPPYDEQVAIAAFLDDSLKGLNALVKRAQSEIELIREYSARLIVDAVTGKVDVRHLTPEATGAEPENLDEGLDDEMGEDDLELAEEVTDADD